MEEKNKDNQKKNDASSDSDNCYDCKEFYKTFFNHLPSCVAIYKAVDNGDDFIILNLNKNAEMLEKVDAEKAAGKKVSDIFPGIKKFGLLEVMKRVHATGIPEDCPMSYYEDERISGWRENYVCRLPGGEIAAIYYDNTTKKINEEERESQNKFLRNVVSSLSHPFYVIDAKTYSLVIANEAALQGRDKEKLHCYEISHNRKTPCGGSEHGCTLETIKKTKKSVTLEHLHYDKEGNEKYVDVHGYPLLDENGEVAQIIEYCIDMTTRKNMEIELKYKEAINKDILENSPFGIYLVGESGKVEYVNQAMLEISGTPYERFIEINILNHEFYKKIGLVDKIKEAFSGKAFKMEKIKYTSSFAGKTTIRNFTGVPIKTEKENKVLIFVEDITKRVEAEQEMVKRAAALEKFNKIAVGRELKMIELKKAIKKLEARLKK